MKLHKILLAACAVCFLSGFRSNAQSSDDQAVMVPIHNFFTGLAHKDKEAMMRPLLPEGFVTGWRNGEARYLKFSEIADFLDAKPQKIEEPLGEPLIRTDETVAMVWVPYSFLVDGKIDHCGTDVFNLLKLHGTWFIAGIADNARTECSDWAHRGKK